MNAASLPRELLRRFLHGHDSDPTEGWKKLLGAFSPITITGLEELISQAGLPSPAEDARRRTVQRIRWSRSGSQVPPLLKVMTSKAVSDPALWAHFRLSIVGSLPGVPVGAWRAAAAFLQDLADKTWTHPVNGGPIQYSASTIERWYRRRLRAKQDPVRVLRRSIRAGLQARSPCPRSRSSSQAGLNIGLRALELPAALRHPAAWVQAHPTHGLPCGPIPRCGGGFRKRRSASRAVLMERGPARRRREIRSYEAEHAGLLWYRTSTTARCRCSCPAASGATAGPGDSRRLLAVKLPSAVVPVGAGRGICARVQPSGPEAGLPRSTMTDGGSAMIAEEFLQGCRTWGSSTR